MSGVFWILLGIKAHTCMHMCTRVIVHFRGHVENPFQKSSIPNPSQFHCLFLEFIISTASCHFKTTHVLASSKLIWSTFHETQLKLDQKIKHAAL